MEKCFRCVSLHLQQAWKNKWITNKWQVFFLTKKITILFHLITTCIILDTLLVAALRNYQWGRGGYSNCNCLSKGGLVQLSLRVQSSLILSFSSLSPVVDEQQFLQANNFPRRNQHWFCYHKIVLQIAKNRKKNNMLESMLKRLT